MEEHPVRCVVYEPSGHWRQDFEQVLVAAELRLALVSPFRAKRFAQALGQQAKTDALDAGMLM